MRVWLLVALGACGRIGFDPLATGDANDDGAAAAPCLQWGTFAAPTRVVGASSSGDDWGATVTSDGLMILWSSSQAGTLGDFDIWMATRATRQDAFGTAINITPINSAARERSPWLTTDGLTIGFTSNRSGGIGGHDLYWATRPSPTAMFGAPQLIANVNTVNDETNSAISANGLRLYFADTDTFVAERATTVDPFGAPVPIAELNSTQMERDVVVSADELEVFFVSTRPGSQGEDIWHSTRPSLADPFAPPMQVPELNTARDDVGPDVSADGTTLYFNYDTVTAGGANSEFYVTTRPCLAR